MKKLNTMGLVFLVLFTMVSVGYSACEGDINCDGDTDGADLALLAADFGTTGCGPYDTLRAYNVRNHYEDLPQLGERVPIITLSLPDGNFIMTITMGARFFVNGVYNADYQSFVDCVCVDQNGSEIQGCGISGGVTGIVTLANNFAQPLFAPTTVTLKCKHESWSDDPMSINISWTAIEVDELFIQNN
ncbi:MAG: hypothetical protein ACQ9MH_26165 [Nitrospinales bacterium]